ncbi:MAG: pyrroloquinoline quinone biosynthesis protein PqqB [Pseudomonadota bacterium]|nr:pyrroloquinoline quinone biosynthesis protein PqqB [Pseudomonadota bacterium]
MTRLRLVVLGSAAGGGLPQWNCRCPVCALAWSGDPRVRWRTQASVAVSADGDSWALVNCAPDVLAQIKATPALRPRTGLRHSPIGAVLLTNGDIDHVAGLLSLREGHSFSLHATPEIHAVLRQNSIFDVLSETAVERRNARFGEAIHLAPGLEAEIFPVPGKTALYLEKGEVEIGGEGEATVGVELRANGASLVYVPGCARLSEALRQRLRGAALVLFDGTVWRDEEMIAAGVGTKTGRRMGHMPISGPEGSIAAFADLGIGRKIFVHINNTNPILVEGSAERREAEAAGWEVAHDGMEIAL